MILKVAALLTFVASALFASAAFATPPSIRYAIALEQTQGQLASMRVNLDLPAKAGKTYVLEVPEDLTSPSAVIFSIEGGEWIGGAVPQDHRLTLKAAASRVMVTYRLAADKADGMRAANQRGIVRAGGFSLRGEDVLVVPQGDKRSTALVRLGGLPGWTTTSSLTGPVPLSKLGDSLFLGGAAYRTMSRTVDGAPFRLTYPESFAPRAEALLDMASAIMTTQRRFWKTSAKPVYIGLVELKDDSGYSGRGLQDGFVLYLGKNADQKAIMRLIAHENLHNWISRAIGGFPPFESDLEAWLNEGFVEAYTARLLLHSGLWTLQDYVDDWNAALVSYGTSPVKTAPNSRILADRQWDFDVNRLPYNRGRLLAVKWDREFREKSGGRIGLDGVLRAQMAQARRLERAGRGTRADRLFPIMAKRVASVDLTAALARYVDRGESLELAKDALGPCIGVIEVTQPVFDRGFDLDATFEARGRVTGLEPGGPAERAGLHTGDKIGIDEIPTNDSRVVLSYKVDDGEGRSHTVSYRPEGTGSVTFQQLSLRPDRPLECLIGTP